MKGLYLSTYNLKKQGSGVSKKINMQILDFKKNDIEIFAPDLSIKNTIQKYINYFLGILPFTSNLFIIKSKKILEKYDLSKINFIYIRKTTFNCKFIKCLIRVRKEYPHIRLFLEIPTYPYDDEYDSIIKKILLNKDKKSRVYLSKVIDRILTYSKDEYIFNVPTIRLSNAVDTKKITEKRVSTNKESIHIIAVALFAYWHGYDRFIKGLADYYNNGGNRNIILHLVGNGPEINNYKRLVESNELAENIIFHGEQFGSQLDKIYDQCEIALDSLARHRSGIEYNSTLKGKEYGAKGLPIISGIQTELDAYKDYKYYMRVPANENPIDIRTVIKFYDKIYNGQESRKEIITNIRTFTKTNFDVSKAMKPIVDYIKYNN